MKSIIKADELSKLYYIDHQQQARYASLRDDIVKIFHKPFQLLTGKRPEREKLWALKNVSFDIKRGEIVGIIGRNGSGKSTLLKILSRITDPTSGSAILNGRVASLLEVGTGFHPELTGRENIFLNGSILGMGRSEITSKFDEIVEFAGVARFLDTPVKFYSSGMYVRLAFSVAAHLEPDILIVDEVLAVGDADFQEKSLGKMKDITRDKSRTVIFVSHNLTAIQAICDRAFVLNQGKLIFAGETKKAISHYLGQAAETSGVAKFTPKENSNKLQFRAMSLHNEAGTQRGEYAAGEQILARLDYEVLQKGVDYQVVVELWNEEGICILATSNYDRNAGLKREEITEGSYRAQFVIPTSELRRGTYYLTLGASIPGIEMLDEIHYAVAFKMGSEDEDIQRFGQGRQGVIYKSIDWEVQKK